MDVLQQILLEVAIALARGREAGERRAEFHDGARVEIVLARLRRRGRLPVETGAGRGRAHVQVVAGVRVS